MPDIRSATTRARMVRDAHGPPTKLTRERVTPYEIRSKVRRVIGKPKWPVAQFNAYLEDLMAAQGIKNRAELSRLTGVGEQQLSQWRHGKNQPTTELLERITGTLDVSLLALQLSAGLVKPDQLEEPPDTTVLPEIYKRSLAAYNTATLDHPELVAGLLERVGHATEWFEVQVALKRRRKKK